MLVTQHLLTQASITHYLLVRRFLLYFFSSARIPTRNESTGFLCFLVTVQSSWPVLEESSWLTSLSCSGLVSVARLDLFARVLSLASRGLGLLLLLFGTQVQSPPNIYFVNISF